ncbi:MAG TPA: DUF2283 domain-containing protein [Acidimicrobiales bacterium]|nr:DUF2283 domain-containing protein [Acidimicrobiales bacterium]
MRTSYDPETNAVYIHLTDEESATAGCESVHTRAPGLENSWIVLDWKDGHLVGIEILDARELLPADFLAGAEQPRDSS